MAQEELDERATSVAAGDAIIGVQLSARTNVARYAFRIAQPIASMITHEILTILVHQPEQLRFIFIPCIFIRTAPIATPHALHDTFGGGGRRLSEWEL